ncbi:MAG: glycolate oxidase subunit GlcE [Pseudomonadota bacterium]
MQAIIEQFSDAIRNAAAQHQLLCIRGSGSKDFYGGPVSGTVLDARPYRGIVSYEPKELVLTARAGTTLAELEKLLSENGQMLPFEPPHFGPAATLGGCIAAGLSGPRRAYQGAARDFVLGVKMLDGRGDLLTFGGQVMKNVAGYDVSRLQAGAMGTLGLLLEISLKVLPRPVAEITLRFDMDQARALETMNRWAGQPLPLSASCHHDRTLTIRLSGAASAVKAAQLALGGETVEQGEDFWRGLREHSIEFFQTGTPLWRLSLPSAALPLRIPGEQQIEWGGALRWCKTQADVQTVRDAAMAAGGQATLFRGGNKVAGVFHPLPEPLLKIHRKLKLTFDPHGVFNIGRMYNF